MRALLAIFAGAALLAVAGACNSSGGGGGGGGSATPTIDQPDLARRALEAMDGLDSFRGNMDFKPPSIGPLLLEFARPFSYRVRGKFSEQSAGGEPVERVIESLFIGARSFHRECNLANEDCGEWSEGQQDTALPPGPSPLYLPQWPFAALAIAEGVKTAGREELNGEPMIKLTGTVNHIRAVLESQRRIYSAAGIETFGELCGQDEPISPDATPSSEQTCREMTYEDALEQQEPALSFYDDHPAILDVWVSEEDSRVHRVEVTVPPFDDPAQGGNPAAQETVVIADYSMFDEVTIEVPL
jgi:hypothetical protein